jgi:hypothetical protein
MSPTGVFTGPPGTILQKQGNILSYKYPTESTFTVLNYASKSIQFVLEKNRIALNKGVNRNATWVKEDSQTHKTWTYIGSLTDTCELCEILPPCPPLTTPPPTGCVVMDCLIVGEFAISGSELCEPDPNDPGIYGQIIICENYVYIYDGTQWKRNQLTTYS